MKKYFYKVVSAKNIKDGIFVSNGSFLLDEQNLTLTYRIGKPTSAFHNTMGIFLFKSKRSAKKFKKNSLNWRHYDYRILKVETLFDVLKCKFQLNLTLMPEIYKKYSISFLENKNIRKEIEKEYSSFFVFHPAKNMVRCYDVKPVEIID